MSSKDEKENNKRRFMMSRKNIGLVQTKKLRAVGDEAFGSRVREVYELPDI